MEHVEQYAQPEVVGTQSAKVMDRLRSMDRSAGAFGSNTRAGHGALGERIAEYWLRDLGLNPAQQPVNHPFDFLCNGKRIEAKSSLPTKRGPWVFTIRGGQDSKCDLYILVCRKVPQMGNVCLVRQSPIGKSSVTITSKKLAAELLKQKGKLELLLS